MIRIFVHFSKTKPDLNQIKFVRNILEPSYLVFVNPDLITTKRDNEDAHDFLLGLIVQNTLETKTSEKFLEVMNRPHCLPAATVLPGGISAFKIAEFAPMPEFDVRIDFHIPSKTATIRTDENFIIAKEEKTLTTVFRDLCVFIDDVKLSSLVNAPVETAVFWGCLKSLTKNKRFVFHSNNVLGLPATLIALYWQNALPTGFRLENDLARLISIFGTCGGMILDHSWKPEQAEINPSAQCLEKILDGDLVDKAEHTRDVIGRLCQKNKAHLVLHLCPDVLDNVRFSDHWIKNIVSKHKTITEELPPIDAHALMTVKRLANTLRPDLQKTAQSAPIVTT